MNYIFGPEEGKLTISDDSNVITYTYPFSNGNHGLGLTPTAGHIEAGTVQYQIDLKEGIDSWQIMPPTDQ